MAELPSGPLAQTRDGQGHELVLGMQLRLSRDAGFTGAGHRSLLFSWSSKAEQALSEQQDPL